MTQNDEKVRDQLDGQRPTVGLQAPRYPSIDIARGVIIIIMALDHVSKSWNAGLPVPSLEGAVGLPPVNYGSLIQQFTRQITHICAPGFQLLAGMGLAISVMRRQARRHNERAITLDIILRGLALCAADFVLMYYAYGKAPWLVAVLACIGSCMIVFSVVRFLPLWFVAILSGAVILASPLYLQSGFVPATGSDYAMNILFNLALAAPSTSPPSFMVIYPILPWIGCFGLGWLLGSLYEKNRLPRGTGVVLLGVGLIAAGIAARMSGLEYFERIPSIGGPASADFWVMAKYPPSIFFLLTTLGAMGVLLGAVRKLDSRETLHPVWRVTIVYGQVALFFYVVHFYLYGLYPKLTQQVNQFSLEITYLVWLAGLVLLYPICVYYGRLRSRHKRFLRYL